MASIPASPRPNAAHRAPASSVVRQRRVVALLAALALILTATGSAPGLRLAWIGAGVAIAALAGYSALLYRARDRFAEAEMRKAFEAGSAYEAGSALIAEPFPSFHLGSQAKVDPLPRPAGALERWALARFAFGCVASMMTPAIALVEMVSGAGRGGKRREALLSALVEAQSSARRHSLRALTVSVAAGATVTAVGAIGSAAFAEGAPSASSYTVQAGDTLYSIASRFGTSIGALASLNGLSNPNLIYAGQVLRLGGSAAPASSTYTVQAGDTLYSIASRFGTSIGALASLNGLSNPNLIYAGQVLRLGGSAAPTASAAHPVVELASTTSQPQAPTSAAGTAVHVALEQLGKPYAWGGAGPASFDCSGLVMYAWDAAGVSLPHYSVSQYDDTTRVSAAQLQPGDIVFYNVPGVAEPGHEALYIGNGEVVAADNYGIPVRVQPIDEAGVPMGYGMVR